MCGLYGTNGKFNGTNGSSGQNGLYRTNGQREWGINWRNSYEQSKKVGKSTVRIYSRECLCRLFYCATAPNIERTVGQRDGRLRVIMCKVAIILRAEGHE